jgi:hypothetical protein
LIGLLLLIKLGAFNAIQKKKTPEHAMENTEFTLARKSTQFKTMLVCFFDHKGIVHYKCFAQGQTVNQQCYFEILMRLDESVQRKRPKLWPDKRIFCHENAPARDALCKFLAKKSIEELDHTPYLPNLALCDFWLFPKLKNSLKKERFADIPDIQQNMTNFLVGISENYFQDFSSNGTIVSQSA